MTKDSLKVFIFHFKSKVMSFVKSIYSMLVNIKSYYRILLSKFYWMMHDQMPFPEPVVRAILAVVQRTIGYRFDEFAPRFRVASVDIPLMLVHGDEDDVVPIANLHELADAHGDAEVIVVPGAGHSDLAPFTPYIGDIVAFLGRNLSPDVPAVTS